MTVRALACFLVAVLFAAPATATCVGDCDGDGEVRINELIAAVGIALGQASAATCLAVDVNGDGAVTITELISATNGLLSGCPAETTATATPPGVTMTPTASPSPSATATANEAPLLPSPFLYRGVVGQPIARPLGAVDPEGGAVTCASDALLAGMSLSDNLLSWTPASDQFGLVAVPVECQDAAEPPLRSDGELSFRIVPPDGCTTWDCDPATGCTQSVVSLEQRCCDAVDEPRIAAGEVFCPAGRELQIGRNKGVSFGPLQSCDHLRFTQRAQTSADIRIHIRVSCVNPLNRVTVKAKLESAVRGVIVSSQANVFLPATPTDGFYERRTLTFPLSIDGPFLDLEETEANLTVTVRDSDGAEVSKTVRVILTSDALLDDLPDP